MNLNSISETLLRRRTASSTQQQQNNVDTNNNGVGSTFGVNFSTSTLASALLISSMNQPSSPRPKKTTNNNVVHKENVGEDNKTSSSRHRQKDDNTSTAKNNNMPPPPPPPPPPGPPPVRRSRNKKINSSLVDDTTKKPSSSSISSSGNSKSISPTLLQRRQMNPLSPVNNNSPMSCNPRGEVVGSGRSSMKEQKSGNVSASNYTSHRTKKKSPIVAKNTSKVVERRRPIVSTTNSTRLPKRRTQKNLATEATRGITTPPNKKLVSPQSKRETSDHQVAVKSSHTTTTSYTTKSMSPLMHKIVAKYGSGSDCSVNHKLLTSPNISDRKQHQHDTIAKQQQASTRTSTLDTNRYANKALQLKRNRQQSIQTHIINTKRKEANKKADIVKQFRQQKHRGRCNTSRTMKNDSTTSTTAAKETSNDCKVQRQRSLSVPRKTTKSLEDGLEEIDMQMDNLAVTQSCSFTTTTTTTFANVDNDETNKRRLQMRRKRAREVLARRNKKI